MRKLIAATNMTLDGYCDHTTMIADDDLHQHYNELLLSGDTIIYGRITYQLMESYWPAIVKEPSGNKTTDEFAMLIDNINKLVFSSTLKSVAWKNSRIATDSISDEVNSLKQKSGKDLYVGSPGLIVQCMNHGLVDELQICVQPVIVNKGLSLFKNIKERTDMKLLKTKTFGSGVVCFYYDISGKP